MQGDKNSQLINPQTEHPRSVVWRWLKIALLASVNVLILALFAGYFDNQAISLLDVIGIIADAMGIVLGLLGIWFFFLSEGLNRTTAINLERTTATVNDLRDQMWGMIQKTFNTFVERESTEQADETRQAIEQLKEQARSTNGAIPHEFVQAIDALNKRLDSIERQRESMAAITASPLNSTSSRVPSLRYVKDVIKNHSLEFPMSAHRLLSLLGKYSGHNIDIDYTFNRYLGTWFTTTSEKAPFLDPSDIVDLGPEARNMR